MDIFIISKVNGAWRSTQISKQEKSLHCESKSTEVLAAAK